MIRKLTLILFLAIAPLAYLLFRLIYFRYVIKVGLLNASRIGNYALVSEIYLCHKKQINIKNNKKYIDLIAVEKPICNEFLHKIIKEKIKFSSYYFIKSFIFFVLLLKKNFNIKETHLLNNTGLLTVNQDRDPKRILKNDNNQIKLSIKDIEKGNKILKTLNINKNDKIVCLIVRDNAYLKKSYSSNSIDTWSYHDYRDCDVENYKLSCEFLSNKGYKVFRMGKIVNKKISFNSNNIFDYPFMNIKSDFMDIFLAYRSTFIISSGVGYEALGGLFRKPILFTNIIPISCLWTWNNKYVATLKHLKFEEEKSYLTTTKHFEQNIAFADKSDDYKIKNIEIIENNPNEIFEATKEMLFYIENGFAKNYKNLNNNLSFWNNFKKNVYLKKKSYDHYGKFYSKVSESFLLKNDFYLK